MGYLGRTPTPSPVTIEDIPANSIDASKIVDGSIEVSDIKDNSITDAKLNSTKLDGIADSANNYSHPAAHTVSEVTGLQGLLDGKTTETYVNTQITNVIGAAPAALDTLTELAAALGDDANYAGSVTNALAGKVDNSQVLTNVPAGALFTDTVYTHPTNHAISVVTGLQTALDSKLPLAGGTMTGAIAGFTSTGIDDNATSNVVTIASNNRVNFAGGSNAFGIYLKYNAATSGVYLGSPSDQAFQVSSAGGSPYLNINNSGNVGIGTSAPTSQLSIGVNQGTGTTDDFLSIQSASGLEQGGISTYNAGGYEQDLIFKTHTGSHSAASTERMRIDSTGIVTMPYQPAFSVSRNSGGAATSQVVFNSVYENIGSNYSATTGRFTAPIAGRYAFSAHFMQASTNSYFLWNFHKNGLNSLNSGWVQCHNYGTTNAMTASASVIATLAAGDYINIVFHPSYLDYYTSGYNNFSGYLIG